MCEDTTRIGWFFVFSDILTMQKEEEYSIADVTPIMSVLSMLSNHDQRYECLGLFAPFTKPFANERHRIIYYSFDIFLN